MKSQKGVSKGIRVVVAPYWNVNREDMFYIKSYQKVVVAPYWNVNVLKFFPFLQQFP